MKFTKFIAIAASAAFSTLAAAHAAPISLGGYDLDDSNFATGADLRYGSGRVFQEGGPETATDQLLSSALSGTNARDGFLCDTSYCEFDVFFGSGIENSDGDDLVLFGMGVSPDEQFDLIINGIRISGLALADTGELILGTTYALTALAIDISDWGFDLGDKIYSIRIALLNTIANKEEFAAFASLSDAETLTNPIPASFILFFCGGGGILAAARKKRLKLVQA